jgi:hypothetical protein
VFAIFVTRTGVQVTPPLVRTRDKLWVKPENGTLVDFSDPLDDGNSPLSLVTTDPSVTSVRPISKTAIPNLR